VLLAAERECSIAGDVERVHPGRVAPHFVVVEIKTAEVVRMRMIG